MKKFSVAEARKSLPSLMQIAEAGEPVLITRRNQPATVLVSEATYKRLIAERPGLVAFLSEWRGGLDSFGGVARDGVSFTSVDDGGANGGKTMAP